MTAAAPSRIKTLRAAYDAARAADRHLDKTLEQLFPVGSTVSWCRGIHKIQTGKVSYAGRYGHIMAINDRTGKTVKLGPFEILAGGEE